MKLLVGGLIEVVEAVDQNVFIEAVWVAVELLCGGKGGTADLVVYELCS